MKERIKNMIATYKMWKQIKLSPAIFKAVYDVFKFVELTHAEQKPMVTEIALFNMKDGTKISDFVSLWAGIGKTSPIERARALKAQNEELKRLIHAFNEGKITDKDKNEIELILKHFE